jgi:hypothetical protein
MSVFIFTHTYTHTHILQLIRGCVLKKHGSWGNPHFRRVWCDESLSCIYWGSVDKNKRDSSNVIPTRYEYTCVCVCVCVQHACFYLIFYEKVSE